MIHARTNTRWLLIVIYCLKTDSYGLLTRSLLDLTAYELLKTPLKAATKRKAASSSGKRRQSGKRRTPKHAPAAP
tara:strand:- start:330 stop:554 length:225 start_codon:yes stop_codon:yes gene_type:complete